MPLFVASLAIGCVVAALKSFDGAHAVPWNHRCSRCADGVRPSAAVARIPLSALCEIGWDIEVVINAHHETQWLRVDKGFRRVVRHIPARTMKRSFVSTLCSIG